MEPLIFNKGLIIVNPHGTYIKNHKKTLIIKSKKISSITNQPLLLIEDKLGLGLLQLGEPKEINLKQFTKLRKYHKITDLELNDWWPEYKTLYAYPITKLNIFKIPVILNYPQGPQITVKYENVFIKRFYIGTSGFTQPITKYNLNSIEINHTFYKIASKTFVDNSNKTDFIYTIKVHKYITHNKQLNEFKQHWLKFYNPVKKINNLVCFLFQFGPRFVFNENNFKKLSNISKHLDKKHLYAFEFRNIEWNNSNVNTLFKNNNWTYVILHVNNNDSWAGNLKNGFNPKISNYTITSELLYIRLHGTKGKYIGPYSMSIFNEILKFSQNNKIKYVMVYFNNTDEGDAYGDAIKLSQRINQNNLGHKKIEL